MFTVYCHTNRLTDKKYVGQTCMGMRKRWYHHVFDAHAGRGCSVFAKAMRAVIEAAQGAMVKRSRA